MAVVTHLGNFGAKFAERFLDALEPTRLTVYGNPSDEAQNALAGLDAVFMEHDRRLFAIGVASHGATEDPSIESLTEQAATKCPSGRWFDLYQSKLGQVLGVFWHDT